MASRAVTRVFGEILKRFPGQNLTIEWYRSHCVKPRATKNVPFLEGHKIEMLKGTVAQVLKFGAPTRVGYCSYNQNLFYAQFFISDAFSCFAVLKLV